MYPMLQSKISQWYCTNESRKTQEPKSSTVAVPLLIWMLWPKDYWDHGKCKVRAWHDIQEWRQVVQHWSIIPRDGQSRKVTWELVPATTTLPCPPPELKLQGSCDGSAINMTTWLQWAQLECSKTLKAKKFDSKPVCAKYTSLWDGEVYKLSPSSVPSSDSANSWWRRQEVGCTCIQVCNLVVVLCHKQSPRNCPVDRVYNFNTRQWNHGRMISTATTEPNI
jgi:hypothetical protein